MGRGGWLHLALGAGGVVVAGLHTLGLLHATPSIAVMLFYLNPLWSTHLPPHAHTHARTHARTHDRRTCRRPSTMAEEDTHPRFTIPSSPPLCSQGECNVARCRSVLLDAAVLGGAVPPRTLVALACALAATALPAGTALLQRGGAGPDGCEVRLPSIVLQVKSHRLC
jgi:hypothetical protein